MEEFEDLATWLKKQLGPSAEEATGDITPLLVAAILSSARC